MIIKLSGNLKKVFPSVIFGSFEKRFIWLEEVSEKYPNTFQLELWQADCNMIDNYKEGDYVSCYIDIKGKQFTKRDGDEGVINTLKCWNIEKDGKTFKEIKN